MFFICGLVPNLSEGLCWVLHCDLLFKAPFKYKEFVGGFLWKAKQWGFYNVKYAMYDINKQKIYAHNYKQSQKKINSKNKKI